MTSENFTTLEEDLSLISTNAYHPSDELGVMVGLDRLEDEPANEFRTRIMDVFVHPAGGDNEGLTIGMNRELGFILERALTISLRNSVDIFQGPKIDVGSSAIRIYSSWNVDGTFTEEMSIDIFNPCKSDWYDYHAYYLIDLVDVINTNSSVFEATLSSTSYSYYLASNLLPTTSTRLARSEVAREEFHRLANDQLIPGSVVLSNSKYINRKYVDMLEWDTTTDFQAPSNDDEYWIDLEQGIVIFGDNPANISVGYMYNELPLTLYMAPIEIYQFTNRDFSHTLSSTRLDPYGNIVSYTPTDLGTKWINMLYKEAQHFWGGKSSRTAPLAAKTHLSDISDLLNIDIDAVSYEAVPQRNFVSMRNSRKK